MVEKTAAYKIAEKFVVGLLMRNSQDFFFRVGYLEM
jgi:hypothetical protein